MAQPNYVKQTVGSRAGDQSGMPPPCSQLAPFSLPLQRSEYPRVPRREIRLLFAVRDEIAFDRLPDGDKERYLEVASR